MLSTLKNLSSKTYSKLFFQLFLLETSRYSQHHCLSFCVTAVFICSMEVQIYVFLFLPFLTYQPQPSLATWQVSWRDFFHLQRGSWLCYGNPMLWQLGRPNCYSPNTLLWFSKSWPWVRHKDNILPLSSAPSEFPDPENIVQVLLLLFFFFLLLHFSFYFFFLPFLSPSFLLLFKMTSFHMDKWGEWTSSLPDFLAFILYSTLIHSFKHY